MQSLEGLDELYEQIVLDHYRNPRHSDLLTSPAVDIEVNNPFCGDEIRLQLKTGDDGRVSAVSVAGRGCAISQSSGSLLTELVHGKDAAGLHGTVTLVRRLMKGDPVSEAEMDALGDLSALSGVRKFPVRIKCALLAWSALEEAAEKLEQGAK
ncbi:MAG: SUF system NifU family Fe-S cluster assembly protein [Dehalococcoidia bacterium]|nr:SUF system NifU family Fe-S cluster assembly protein [Dehalococcoidia bacterium]MSQ35397.1 SUF system NifU family Fe-S cluster assembly protein [Dehalococcoidia bacterium]